MYHFPKMFGNISTIVEWGSNCSTTLLWELIHYKCTIQRNLSFYITFLSLFIFIIFRFLFWRFRNWAINAQNSIFAWWFCFKNRQRLNNISHIIDAGVQGKTFLTTSQWQDFLHASATATLETEN